MTRRDLWESTQYAESLSFFLQGAHSPRGAAGHALHRCAGLLKGGKRAGRPDPEAMIGLLKAYKEANGHVNVPLDHTAELEGREKPVRLGRWLAAVRKNAAKVKPGRVAALDAVDPKWRGD